MMFITLCLQKLHKNASGTVTSIDAELHLEGDFKKTKLKLTWLGAEQELVPLTLTYFGLLITKKKLEEEDDFTQFINSDTVRTPCFPVAVHWILGDERVLLDTSDASACRAFLSQKCEVPAQGDLNMATLRKGEVIQLERKGFFIVDKAADGPRGQPAVLFNIPDGRAKGLGASASVSAA